MTQDRYSVRFLGNPSVTDSRGNAVPTLGLGKPLGMLAYLLLHGEVRRDELVALFWGNLPEQKARNAFRQTLHRLRGALGTHRMPSSATTVHVIAGESLWVDVTAFESALKLKAFEEALGFYRGPFLNGFDTGETSFDSWVTSERNRLEARYEWALQHAVNSAMGRGNLSEASRLAKELTKISPHAAEPALAYASVLIASGRSAEARAALDEFVLRYRAEIEHDIPPAVREMLGRLRRQAPAKLDESEISGAPKFIGREEELNQLLGIWRDVKNSKGAAVVIDGEEGIGKSAFVDEFVSRVSKLGPMLLLSGREQSGGAMLPYASVAAALRGALAAPGIAGTSQHLLAEAARLLPELRDQFSLPVAEAISDEGSRLRFFEGVAALVESVAYEQPVCLVLEDFHHAAASTVRMLEFLRGRLGASAVLFVLVKRSDHFSAQNRHCPVPAGVEEITLHPLSETDAIRLVQSTSDSELLQGDEAGRIARLSGGVPYRAIELARQAAGGMNPTAVPATLKDILNARLRGCSPSQQRFFIVCALIDGPMPIKVLAAASHLSDTAALDAVLALEGLGLLVQSETGVRPASEGAGALGLEGSGPAGRALLAGWAAEALEKSGAAQHAELAHLHQLAGNRAATFHFSVAATYEAGAAAATESVTHFLLIARKTVVLAEERKELAALEGIFGESRKRIAAPASQAKTAGDRADPGTYPKAAPRRNLVESLGDQVRHSPMIRAAAIAALLLGSTALALNARNRRASIPGPVLPDTLFLSERSSGSGTRQYYLTGELIPGVTQPTEVMGSRQRSWTDSLTLPWMNARVAPGGKYVAIERMTEGGPDIYLMTADRKETRKLAVGSGDDIIAGWSPDGEWLLATHGQTLNDGSYDSDLYAISADGSRRLALDTSSARSVVEAEWSPDGTHIAWTARTGSTHQQDIFVSDADGTNLRNISNHPSEDYHIKWSPDGGRIAFTSERSGNADIYSYELETSELRRLTWDPAQDDRAIFSPDGNFIAFESTRGGAMSVYVMRSWSGSPVRATGPTLHLSVLRWGAEAGARRASAFMQRVRIEAPPWLATGDTASLIANGYNDLGRKIPTGPIRWELLDRGMARIAASRVTNDVEATPAGVTLIGLRSGMVRIAASAGGWRADTAFLHVGSGELTLLDEEFEGGLEPFVWRKLGRPEPRIIARISHTGGHALAPNSDRQWESGVLTNTIIPMQPGLSAHVWVKAPLAEPTSPKSFSFALVAPGTHVELDTAAPRPTRLASIDWLAQAARFAYVMDRESVTEPVSLIAAEDWHLLQMDIDSDRRISFSIDGKVRWRSNLRIPFEDSRVQLWLASQGAGESVIFDDLVVVMRGAPGGTSKRASR